MPATGLHENHPYKVILNGQEQLYKDKPDAQEVKRLLHLPGQKNRVQIYEGHDLLLDVTTDDVQHLPDF